MFCYATYNLSLIRTASPFMFIVILMHLGLNFILYFICVLPVPFFFFFFGMNVAQFFLVLWFLVLCYYTTHIGWILGGVCCPNMPHENRKTKTRSSGFRKCLWVKGSFSVPFTLLGFWPLNNVLPSQFGGVFFKKQKAFILIFRADHYQTLHFPAITYNNNIFLT